MASSLYNKISRIQQMKNSYITATNLRTGVNVFGVNGTYTADANATSGDIASGKTAYVNGSKYTGILPEYSDLTRNVPWGSINDDSTNQCLRINYSNTTNLGTRPSYHTNCGNAILRNGAYFEISYSNLVNELGIDAVSIKKDVTIAGVTGQYDASTEFSGIKMDPIVASDSAQSLTASITEVSGLDMTQGTNLANYFNSLYGLTSVSNINAPNVTNLYGFCNYDYSLKKFEHVNFYNEEQSGVNCAFMFNYCRNLLELPNSVIMPKQISGAWYMFTDCWNLKEINTPLNISNPNVQRLFYNCSNLINIGEHIQLPSAGTYQTNYMFYNCINLDIANVNLHGINLTNYSSSMFHNVANSNRSGLNKFFANIGSAYVNGGLLSGSNIESVDCDLWEDIPQLRYTNNLSSAFTSCYNLKTVNLYKGTYSTMLSCFSYCYNLTDVNITTKNIAFGGMTNTLYQCCNLINANIDLNTHITSMSNTFYNCCNLVNLNLYNSYSQTSVVSLDSTFFNCFNLNSYKANILAGVNILNRSFYNCISLKEVRFNSTNNWFDNLVMASYAFYNCSNLQTIDDIRDINLSFLGYTNTGIFYNCANLNINSINYNISTTGDLGAMSSLITNNPFLTSINITINGKVPSSYYGCNMTNMVVNCSNLQTANINLLDYSTATNTWNIGAFISTCPNLKDLYINIYTNSNRTIYASPVTYVTAENLYYNSTRNNTRNMSTEINLYGCNINNLNGYIDGINANLVLRVMNVNNLNITLSPNVVSYSYYLESMNINKQTFDINCSNINYFMHMNYMTIEGPTTVNVNYCNAKGYYLNRASVIFKNSQTLENIYGNFSNLTNMYYFNICQMNNLKEIELDFSSLINVEYQFMLRDLGSNCQNINIHMPNLQVMNYDFTMFNCNGLTDIAFNWGSSLNRLYQLQVQNCNSLKNIHMDYPNIKNVYVNGYVRFANCKSLTDETIDNLFGMLSNLSHLGTKYINYSFYNCNLSQERAQNLANYNNLISAGWTY